MAEVIGSTFTDDVDALTSRLSVIDARMAGLELRLADADEAAILLPDQGDVIDAQMRAARLAADLQLVAIELRSELQRLRAVVPDTLGGGVDDLAERLIDLTAD